VRDAIGCRSFAHGNADVPGLGPIVDFREDVRMNIDHDDLKNDNKKPARNQYSADLI
jgi:hypothetical protein